MEEIILYLSKIDMFYVYMAVLLIAYIENIFPPFPSDVIVVFAGSLVAVGKGSGILTVALATFGSTLGFMCMYWIGAQTDRRVLEAGKLKFVSRDLVGRVERWFRKYGYWVVVINRFMAGTRAVVSFCAGLSGMRIVVTTVLSAVSALAWNIILVYMGIGLGSNWRSITHYLATYSKIVSFVLAGIVLIWAAVAFIRYTVKARRNSSRNRRNPFD